MIIGGRLSGMNLVIMRSLKGLLGQNTGRIPVSYTHLDVYKRQFCTCRHHTSPLFIFCLDGLVWLTALLTIIFHYLRNTLKITTFRLYIH